MPPSSSTTSSRMRSPLDGGASPVMSRRKGKASFSSFSHRALVTPSETAAMIEARDQEVHMQRLLAFIFAMTLAVVSLGVVLSLSFSVVLAADTVELVSQWNPVGALPDGCSPALTGGGPS